jgi:hypothetical protein
LLLIAVFLGLGLSRPLARDREDARLLLHVPAERARYEHSVAALNNPRQQPLPAMQAQLRRRGELPPPAATMLAIAQHARLQRCRLEYGLVQCEGRHTEDTTIVGAYLFGSLFLLVALFGWLMLVGDSAWTVPRWSRRLWATPVCGAAVILLTAGPFLMRLVYVARSNHANPATPAAFPGPSLALYGVAALQATAAIVAILKARPTSRTVGFWLRGPAVFVLGLVLCAFLPKGHVQTITAWAAIAAGLVVIPLHGLLTGGTPRRRGVECRTPNVLELSWTLLPAWAILAVVMTADWKGATRDAALGLCVSTCVFHVWWSRFAELGPKRHGDALLAPPAESSATR